MEARGGGGGASFRRALFEERRMSLRKDVQRKALPVTMARSAAQDAALLALKSSQWLKPEEVECHEEIGEGAFAVVYHGRCRGEKVAIKAMKVGEGTSRQRMDDFCAEIGLLASLSHPNIVRMVGACVTDSRLEMVMELVEGGDAMLLSARDDVRLDWRRRLTWMAHIASALGYLHAKSIIHRDIKTENILIVDMDKAKLCDFGLAMRKGAKRRELRGPLTASTKTLAAPSRSTPTKLATPVLSHTATTSITVRKVCVPDLNVSASLTES